MCLPGGFSKLAHQTIERFSNKRYKSIRASWGMNCLYRIFCRLVQTSSMHSSSKQAQIEIYHFSISLLGHILWTYDLIFLCTFLIYKEYRIADDIFYITELPRQVSFMYAKHPLKSCARLSSEILQSKLKLVQVLIQSWNKVIRVSTLHRWRWSFPGI